MAAAKGKGRTADQPNATPAAKGADQAAEVRGFEVQLGCPHCGGPFVASDATVSHICEHCQSLLIIDAPEREEIFIEPASVREPQDILETLLRYRLDAHRATLVARHSSEDGTPPPEMMIDALLTRFEKKLRAVAKILDCRLIQVPYRQTSGKVIQAVLGRFGDGPKIARLRAYTAEQTAPAYDGNRINMRDAGLRLGRSVFRPLLSADVPRLGTFVPRSAASSSRRELEKWRLQSLEPGFNPVARDGQVVVTFEATVYRPYFLVQALLDQGVVESILFDGGFGAIAGYLQPDEAPRFTRGSEADPLGTAGASFRHVAIVPARCPNCGADPKLPEDAVISICENCHAGVAPTPQGIVRAAYEREEALVPRRDMALLPFWRFPFTIEIKGSPPFRDLGAYADAIFPQGLPKGFAPTGPFVYVPAWRLLTTKVGDETFVDLAEAIHVAAWNWTPDPVSLEARPRRVAVSLPEPDARALVWATLFAMHTKPSAARLNTLLLKRVLFDAKLTVEAGSVVFIAFAEQGDLYARPEVSLPRLLIDGGPLLAAQRVSVQSRNVARL